MSLSEQHRQHLTDSAIDPEVAEREGVRTVSSMEELPDSFRIHDNRYLEKLVPALAFPWKTVSGDTQWQIRPDTPLKDSKGRDKKYVFPKGCGSFLHVAKEGPGNTRSLLVEGTKQVRAAARYAPEGWNVYGLAGCYNWVESGLPIQDLHVFEGHSVVVLLDADLKTNRSVYDSAGRLLEALKAEGAEAKFAPLPTWGTNGIDDLLAGRPEDKRATYLQRLAENGLKSRGSGLPSKAPSARSNKFRGPSGEILTETLAEGILDKAQGIALTPEKRVAVYQNGVYSVDGFAFVNVLRELLGETYSTNARITMEEVIGGELQKRGLVLPDHLSEPYLNTSNGMLNLSTMELEPWSPKFLSPSQIPVAWDPAAECPTYEEWLLSVVGDQGDDLEEVAGTMLDPSITPSKALFAFGPSRSGKSTFIRTMEEVVGRRNVSAVSLHALTESEFATANLYGKMLNSCADLSARDLQDLEQFKKATGGDMSMGNRKYGQQFEFVNRALFAFSANEIPASGEKSSAYLERVKPFHFPNSFAGSENRNLERQIREELPGILARWVRAYHRLSERGNYGVTNAEVRSHFARSSNRVEQWLHERAAIVATTDDGRSVATGILLPRHLTATKTDCHRDYKRWAEANGFRPLGKHSVSAALTSVNGVFEVWTKENRTRALNIKILPPDEEKDSGPLIINPPAVAVSQFEKHCGDPHTLTSSSEENTDALISNGARNCDSATGAMGFDLETAGAERLHTYPGQYIRLSGAIIPEGSRVDLTPAELVERLGESGEIYGHNVFGFDLMALSRYAGADYLELASKTVDTFTLARLADPPGAKGAKPWSAKGYYGLNEVAERLGLPGKTDHLPALAKEFGGFDKIPVDDPRYREYLKGDLEATRAVYEKLTEGGISDYARREMRVSAIQNLMCLTGFRVDEALLEARVTEEAQKRSAALSQLQEQYGVPREGKKPWTSTGGREALVEAFRQAGAPHVPRTPSGAVALGKDSLSDGYWMNGKGREAKRTPGMLKVYGHIPEVREIVDLLNTVTGASDKYQEIADYVTEEGRVHPSVGALQASGRWAMVTPSLTNLGKRGGKVVQREVFIPEEGHVILAADFDQVDMRAVAGHSQDREYMKLFEPGRDVHSEIATAVFGRADGEWREKAKAIGHGWNYGRGVRAISEGNGIDYGIVEQFDTTMRERYTRLVEWKQEVIQVGESGVLLDNGFGRLMRCDPERAYTQAPSLMGQGGARDIMCEGLLRLPEEMLPMLRAVVHDEAVFSVPEEDWESYGAAIVEAFTLEFKGVPITSGLSKPGRNWAHAYRKGD